MCERIIGPALPPHLQHLDVSPTTEGPRGSVGPSLPPGTEASVLVGPRLPPGMRGTPDSDGDEEEAGPSLMRHKDVIGPSLGGHEDVIGPTPGGLEDSDSDEEVIGPLPSGHEDSGGNKVQRRLEARAFEMKRKLAGEGGGSELSVPARETWMLELPPDRAQEFGLGPRQFRARARPELGDRSLWTDTPQDRELKANQPQVEVAATSSLKTESEALALVERDREMQRLTDKHNKKKKRKESLIDLHTKKLRKKQKKEDERGKPKERRPFDRNVDLQANRFDEAQKKAILRKAQLLDDRFSRGQSKFL